MLALLCSWILIFFCLFSLGDILLATYNKLCKSDEKYNLLEKNLLGLSLLLLLLPIWSFVMPANHYFFLPVLGLCLIYWIYNRNRMAASWDRMRVRMASLTPFQIALVVILLVLFMMNCVWVEGNYDAIQYHYQHIRWNEEYPIVTGMANLNDKFGFNSNMMLVYAVFSLRFLFGEAVYSIQSLFAIMFTLWLVYQVFISKYELKRVFLLIGYILFYMLYIRNFSDTSTDFIPNIIVFYFIAQTIISPDFVKNKLLFLLVVPAMTITLKLSMAPLLIFSLYVLYILFKEKKYSPIYFVCIFNLLLVSLWMTRNVLISGYLIYPMYSIDLFSVDWKLPIETVMSQKAWIKEHAVKYTWLILTQPTLRYDVPLWYNLLIILMYLVSTIALVLGLVNLWRKRKEMSAGVIISWVVIICSLILWFTQGPTIRFIGGLLAGLIGLGFSSFFLNTEKRVGGRMTAMVSLLALFLLVGVWSSRRLYDRFTLITERGSSSRTQPFSSIWLSPYSHFMYLDAINNINRFKHFTPHEINNGIILYTAPSYINYDFIPAIGMTFKDKDLYDYECIEARGTKIEDGFRMKKDCK